jgi:hypothetical protein
MQTSQFLLVYVSSGSWCFDSNEFRNTNASLDTRAADGEILRQQLSDGSVSRRLGIPQDVLLRAFLIDEQPNMRASDPQTQNDILVGTGELSPPPILTQGQERSSSPPPVRARCSPTSNETMDNILHRGSNYSHIPNLSNHVSLTQQPSDSGIFMDLPSEPMFPWSFNSMDSANPAYSNFPHIDFNIPRNGRPTEDVDSGNVNSETGGMPDDDLSPQYSLTDDPYNPFEDYLNNRGQNST